MYEGHEALLDGMPRYRESFLSSKGSFRVL
jgi:hypothetical protein